MEGQVQEELVVFKDHHTQSTIKGKRTKRQRIPSPLRLAMPMPSSTSSSAGRTSTDNSSTSSPELRDRTQEEEDMANCLILLAQGHARKISSSEPVNVAQPHNNYVYQCKTCNRCFPSFQALGGHRASHKKPKPNNTEGKQAVTFLINEEDRDLYDHTNTTSTTLSLQLSNRALYSTSTANNKPKVHECSICGAEFSSGQALGGHMRRHRTFTNTSTTTSSSEAKKPRNVLKLDLNLPAPEDDLHRESKFPFQSKGKVLVFSASSLVDCHY